MMKRTDLRIFLALGILAAVFWLGTRISGAPSENGASASQHEGHAAEELASIWTCSMHPQIQLPTEGDCPICGMDLIPLVEDGVSTENAEGPRMTMSVAAMKLAEIQTVEVVRRRPHVEIRMVGKVEVDETQQRQISAWVGGRIDRMYVDYTGVAIRSGDHLASIYSPELVNAQDELLQALRAAERLAQSDVSVLRDTAAGTVDASREKLRLLGLSQQQIEQIEKSGKVEDHVTINSPIDGVVIAKHAVAGDYVETGAAIYEIADLSTLWVKMDAYESDLAWLRYGQNVRFTPEAYPGRRVEGTIAFIDPVIDPRTRTTKVRVNLDNADRLLKPGMFVRAVVEAEVAAGGRVIDESLRGKWISPMHPEIVKDRSGSCDVCGMALVRAEELGYVTAGDGGELPLVIPTSAPLRTGKRAVVYIQVPNTDRPTFEGREVVLGPRAGNDFLVMSGLREGEFVVTRGAFKIDSAMQISAKPSMMSPQSGVAPPSHDHGAHRSAQPVEAPREFKVQLGRVLEKFLDLTEALAGDDGDGARAAAAELMARLEAVDMGILVGDAHGIWMSAQGELKPAIARLAGATTLEELRSATPEMTRVATLAVEQFGVAESDDVRRFHCPMAFDGSGADWLQRGESTANPFYGASMLRCGDQQQALHIGSGGER